MSYTQTFLTESKDIIDRIDIESVEAMADAVVAIREAGGRLFFIGSGGGAGASNDGGGGATRPPSSPSSSRFSVR